MCKKVEEPNRNLSIEGLQLIIKTFLLSNLETSNGFECVVAIAQYLYAANCFY
jgi:hypothetical protein